VLRKIEDRFRDADAYANAMGAAAFEERLYSGRANGEFTWHKEELLLGFFAQEYNKLRFPQLVWADHHAPHTNRADFSVYSEDRNYVCDIEMTAVFSKPTKKNPSGYEDYSPFSVWPDPVVPGILHQDIDRPPKVEPYAWLRRVIETHLRKRYSSYWLVIYDNEHAVHHPNLDQLAEKITGVLEDKASRNRLPSALKQVWGFDHHGAIQAFPF